MKLLTTLLMTAVLASSAIAGPIAKNPKAPVMPAPEPDCFAPGFTLGGFAAGVLNNGRNIDDALGGGILAEYFFTENIGIQGSYSAYATNQVMHNVDASIVLRAPIRSLSLAPYIMGGGGFVNNPNEGSVHAGAGVDYRLSNCMGIFADGAFHWADAGDYTLVRLGLKIPF